MGVKDYDLNPDNNTLINGINIAEGCPPSGINNAIRQIMADVKEDSDAQNEALKKFSETPASAEDLGPVKVGDGLSMGEDGTLSLDLVDGVDSTSTTQAPTAAAVKKAYDKASELNWIGVPRYWRSKTLPPNHCWANGDFINFADWPELKAVYDAGGFEGMLMAWDADSETQAANLGQWRPDAAEPTGLYTPNLTGQFMRCWTAGEEKAAGAWGRDEIRNIMGTAGDAVWGLKEATGAFEVYDYQGVSMGGGSYTYPRNKLRFDASKAVQTGTENVPKHVWVPLIIYLGNPA
jgi:hypothetical protein